MAQLHMVTVTRRIRKMATTVFAALGSTGTHVKPCQSVLCNNLVARNTVRAVAKAYMVLVQTNAGSVATLLNDAAHHRRMGRTVVARNSVIVARSLRVGHATGNFVSSATAAAQLATLVSVNAARIAALTAPAPKTVRVGPNLASMARDVLESALDANAMPNLVECCRKVIWARTLGYSIPHRVKLTVTRAYAELIA